jgi:hypothetical protein
VALTPARHLYTTNQSDNDDHRDLLDPIFTQLLMTKSARLRRIIEDWHLNYHSEDKSITPITLVDAAGKKCKALRRINQLHIPAETEIMTLEATIKQRPDLATSVYQALLKTISKDNTNTGVKFKSQQGTKGKTRKPDWYHNPPSHHGQTHTHDNRVWHWCPKCGDNGKWVCTHMASQHQDSFTRKRKSDATQGTCKSSPPPTAAAYPAAPVNHSNMAKLVADQVLVQLQAHLAAIQQHQTHDDADQCMEETDW